MKNIKNNLKKLIDIGRALSREKNISILLEKILNEARIISNSDGGTVYLVTEDGKKLNFEIMHTQSLDIKFGGSSMSVPDTIYPVKIYNDDGTENIHNVAAVCVLEGKTINIFSSKILIFFSLDKALPISINFLRLLFLFFIL